MEVQVSQFIVYLETTGIIGTLFTVSDPVQARIFSIVSKSLQSYFSSTQSC